MPAQGNLAKRALSRVGRVLRGRYRVGRLLGIGGMAAVYAGAHRNGHPVAIKILHEHYVGDDDVHRLFSREAYVANQVGHPGAVSVLDDDVDEAGCAFLVMPLLIGETLRARCERSGQHLPLAEVLVIADAVLAVLADAHAKGIVHRDIKPENLFVTNAGELKVLDFGIARAPDADGSATGTGRAFGTPAFMPPEQALGRRRAVGPHSDCWSVGATMFTLLSGQHVHHGEGANEILVATATRPARAMESVAPEIPESVRVVIDTALAFDVTRRWRDAAAMREALQATFSTLGENALAAARAGLRRDVPSDAATADAHSKETLPPLWEAETENFRDDAQAPSAPALNAANRAFRRQPTETLSGANSAATQSLKVPAGVHSQQIAGRRRRVAWIAGATLVIAGVGFGTMRLLPRAAPTNATTSSDLADGGLREGGRLVTANPEVLRHVAAARRAWLDANTERARDEARAALSLDEHNASAHLAYVVATPFWPDDESRKHFADAHAGRDALGTVEREYLDALAPAMVVPGDFRAAAGRLEALWQKSPDDLSVRIALADMWTRLDELERPLGLLHDLAEAANAPGIVLARYAGVAALRDDVDEARVMFSRCLDNDPGASVCASMLAGLELNEGRCTQADLLLRRQLSVKPDAGALLSLAYNLGASGATSEEVGTVLDKWARTFSGPEKDRNGLRAEIRVAMMRGQLREALRLYEKLGVTLNDVEDDAEHFWYTASRMELEAELGDRKAAHATLAKYVNARHVFRRAVQGDDNVTYLLAIGAEFGFVPWPEWIIKRDERLASRHVRDDLLEGRARAWHDLFATPAATKQAAAVALAELRKKGRFIPRMNRWFSHDASIGRMFALTGQVDEAIPHFERAAASCNGLDDLVEYFRAVVDLGEVLERRGDVRRACSMYAKVLRSWRQESGSLSAERAATRSRAVCGNISNDSESKRR